MDDFRPSVALATIGLKYRPTENEKNDNSYTNQKLVKQNNFVFHGRFLIFKNQFCFVFPSSERAFDKH